MTFDPTFTACSYREYPEPPGYSCTPTFVKSNPLNNKAYLAKCEAFFPAAWMKTLRETDEALEALVPGYNISQVKEKFGTLCYYIDLPPEASPEVGLKAYQIVQAACQKAGPFQPPTGTA